MTEPAIYGTSLWGEPLEPPPAPNKLSGDFLVPPFSVLNAREGWWQDRKRAWIGLGIKSELGRGSNELGLSGGCEEYRRSTGDYNKDVESARQASPGGNMMPAMRQGKEGITTRGTGNGTDLGVVRKAAARCFGQDLMRGEHVLGMAGNQDDNQSGTSIFDPVICELTYRWFSPVGGQVLDPFAGGSVRGIVAAMLGRKYWGCDLRAEQIAANDAQAVSICNGNRPAWVCGDSRERLTEAPLADLVFSCPPYGNLEKYSDDARDLSAMPHERFLEAYRQIIAAACQRLRPDRFACFVVGDFRDPRGHYRDFPSETIKAFKLAGLDYYNEAILVTAVGSLPIRITKQFTSGRKLGKTHQNVLVFVKGDWRKAAAACELKGAA